MKRQAHGVAENMGVARLNRAWGGGFAWLWDRRVAVVVGLGLLFAAGFNGVWRITPDSALYANLGRSLVAGQGMVDGLGQANPSPAGLPWVLGWLGGPGPAAQGFMLGCAAAVLGLTFLVMRRVGGGGQDGAPFALAVTLGVALSHLFYEQTLNLLTELPFAVGLMLLLLGHEWRRDAGWPAMLRAWGLIGLGFAVMAAFRSVAAVVAAAYLASALWDAVCDPAKRKWAVVVLAGGAGAMALAWWGSAAVRDDVRLFVWHVQAMDLGRSAHNLWLLLTEHLVEVTLGMDADPVTGCVVSSVLIAGGVMLLRVRRFWGVLWIANVLQWVVFLPEGRYCLPLMPLLVVGLLQVFAALTARLGEPHRARVRWGLVAVVGVGNLVGVVDAVRDQRVGGGEAGFYAAYRDGKYASWYGVAQQVRRETLPGQVVAVPEAIHADTFGALSGRRVCREEDLAALQADWWVEEQTLGGGVNFHLQGR